MLLCQILIGRCPLIIQEYCKLIDRYWKIREEKITFQIKMSDWFFDHGHFSVYANKDSGLIRIAADLIQSDIKMVSLAMLRETLHQ